MDERRITKEQMIQFEAYLLRDEKSANGMVPVMKLIWMKKNFCIRYRLFLMK